MKNNCQVISEMNLPTKEGIELEIAIHQKFINEYKKEKVNKESVEHFFEKFSLYPQNLFFLTMDKIQFVGRKTLSKHYLKGDLLESHCTEIDAHMLLGKLLDEQISEQGIHLYFTNMTKSEKDLVINKLMKNNSVNISYKYVFFYKNQLSERSSPIDGWKLNTMRATNLSNGENIIRKFTNSIFLKDFNLTNKLVYDPSCSTGKFLSEIKKYYPSCYTLGQDISESMTEFAKDKVDEVHCLDAKVSPRNGRFADFIFIRFLNSEVIKRENAKLIYKNIIKRINKGGYIVILGHTPILLSLYDMALPDYEIIRANAYSSELQSVFQYYVIRYKG